MQKFTLEIALPLERWGERRNGATRRRESGRTSIRVSKSTLEALRAFSRLLKETAVAGGEFETWSLSDPSPDAILEAVATGRVTFGHALPAAAVVGMPLPSTKKHAKSDRKGHASKRSPKGMRVSSSKGMPKASRR